MTTPEIRTVSNGASGPLWWAGLPTGPTRAPLSQAESVDVVIVGGGFTGLWSAYYLLESDPSLSVLVLEAEHVGFGASGRNGGWVSALYPVGARVLAREHGKHATRDQYAALRESVDEVGAVAAAEGIECGFHKGGTLVVSTNPAQATRSRAEVRESVYWGTGMSWLDAAAAADRFAINGLHGATFNP
ncbi:MAG TPA: FAD-dependent oxidoreductase, partial [Dermatophilaceae bacterium]